MTEIQQLIVFMRSGKRKTISLSEYERSVHKEGWSTGSKAKLINQVQKSGILRYEWCKKGYVIRLVR
ncbi:TetR family transcriptional regulator [Enterococcus durans]|uniref:TetR family transcriptional regulator n=1 Tax=Enterococcus TaxID=1350 RepID=UPI0028918218|nr:TetR family transcriptional regulator [Enterococcus durans]MDT2836375.1 TetR family transcriptional regulator [Enterococcus durans]